MPTEAQRAAQRERSRRFRETHREQRIAEARAYREANPDRDRDYYLANREKIIERARARYEAQREAILEKNRARYVRNRSAIRAQQAEERARDPETARERGRAFLAANRDRVNAERRAKRAANPRHFQCMYAAWRARKLGAPAEFTPADWDAAIDFFGEACAYCGAAGALEIEHAIPLQRTEHSPTHSPENVVPSCRPCNTSKRNRLVSEWRPEIAAALAARVRDWNPALAERIALGS